MPLTKGGGKPKERDVNDYQEPVGPTSVDNPKSPGLHGDKPRPQGTQGEH